MTFELLLKPLQSEKRPYLLFFFTFFVTAIAIILGYNIFPDSSSVLIITFCIIPLIPIMVRLIEIEEVRFERIKRWYRLKNYRIIRLYSFLFLGFVISFSLFYTFLPREKADAIFKEQINTLYDNQPISARLLPEGIRQDDCDTSYLSKYIGKYDFRACKVKDYYKDGDPEYLIWLQDDEVPSLIYNPSSDEFTPYRTFIRKYFFFHNIRLLIFIFLTSFIFGSGALFILTWNASIVGVYIGESAIRFVNLFAKLPFAKVSAFFTALPMGLGKILFHGIPELLGFFVSAFAGGILSAALIRHKPMDKEFRRVMLDAIMLFALSVLLIFIASFIESWTQ